MLPFVGNTCQVFFLLSAGTSENKKQVVQTGISPLIGATKGGHANVVRLLLEKGLEAVGGISAMPEALRAAILEKRTTILQMVVQAGDIREEYWADNVRYEGGVSALHQAVLSGVLPATQLLLSAVADVPAVILEREVGRLSDIF